MRVVVKNPVRDFLAFGRHLKMRKKIFRASSDEKKSEGSINLLSRELHPLSQPLKVAQITEESAGVRTFRLVPVSPDSRIAGFRAGQYLVLSFIEDKKIFTRPYSISSSPGESREGNFYDITIKLKDRERDGFFSDAVFRTWSTGTPVSASGPQGQFYYEPLRDALHLVCIAGGSGITPFRSIIPEELEQRKDLQITLFYGINTPGEYTFREDFESLAGRYSERFRLVPVVVHPDAGWKGRTGFINADLLREQTGTGEGSADHSFFICGPPGLHRHITSELKSLSLRKKFLRFENYGEGTRDTGPDLVYQITVVLNDREMSLPASSRETLLTALERAGIDPPSACRSGECGWCRSRLLGGEISAGPEPAGVRKADRKFGWFHPCISYPLSNIRMGVPDNPVPYPKGDRI